MIPDSETNKVYFSGKLKLDFPKTCFDLENRLKSFNCKYEFLPETKDIWARDYMPIQVSIDRFIEYRYDPDYLQGNWKNSCDLKTYPDIVCVSIGLKTDKSDLIIDGGNFVKSSDCIILTDKIVKENRYTYSKQELIEKLQRTFCTNKVVLIPWDTKEKYGHSDGMLRFIDNKTVLINHIYRTDSVLNYRLKQAGLHCEYLNYEVKKRHKYNWAYINFLQTKDLILLPKFNIEEDNQAFKQISDFYPDYAKNKSIAQVDMTDVVRFGGALNCIAWTIKI
jgi:agmatine/peptidylarginine deiminase